MGRVGVLPEQEPEFFDQLVRAQRWAWEGLYSHFATSDETDKTYARAQLARFKALMKRRQAQGPLPPMVHMANNGAVLDMPDSYFNACRRGVMLYGHYPSRQTSRSIPYEMACGVSRRVQRVVVNDRHDAGTD